MADLVVSDSHSEATCASGLKEGLRKQVDTLVEEGKRVRIDEYHPAQSGFPVSYVAGHGYDKWMENVNIFNERHLKGHPSYTSIQKTYKQRKTNSSACDDMIAQLEVVAEDEEFWKVDMSRESGEKSMDNHNNKVFIVHGHDESAKEKMARFIAGLGFEPIILNEQADGGMTIIEKIENYTDVAYAVVLYTRCDLGRDKNAHEDQYRARQNVVFEHGYLMGKLGREKVCAVVVDGVETPGDISGVVYKALDQAGAWKLAIAKEMKQAGLAINPEGLF